MESDKLAIRMRMAGGVLLIASFAAAIGYVAREKPEEIIASSSERWVLASKAPTSRMMHLYKLAGNQFTYRSHATNVLDVLQLPRSGMVRQMPPAQPSAE